VTALKQKRKIAGYDCTAFKVSGQDNGEKFDLTCWVTNQALPFKHANFPMFSMMNAGPLGIPGNPLRGILAFDGNIDNKPIKISVSRIVPNNQTIVFGRLSNVNYTNDVSIVGKFFTHLIFPSPYLKNARAAAS
jgi:hypothetical protein